MIKTVVHGIQSLSDDQPFGTLVQMFRLDEDHLYEVDVIYQPEYRDGKPTGRRWLEVKVKQLDV